MSPTVFLRAKPTKCSSTTFLPSSGPADAAGKRGAPYGDDKGGVKRGAGVETPRRGRVLAASSPDARLTLTAFAPDHGPHDEISTCRCRVRCRCPARG